MQFSVILLEILQQTNNLLSWNNNRTDLQIQHKASDLYAEIRMQISYIGRSLKVYFEIFYRIQKRAKVLSRVYNSFDSLEYRRHVACVTLFYRYYNKSFSGELGNLVPENHVFVSCMRALAVDLSIERIVFPPYYFKVFCS